MNTNNYDCHNQQIKHLLTERKIVDVSRRGSRLDKDDKKTR